jgi:hypothetical protein
VTQFASSAFLLISSAVLALAQVQSGEIRLLVIDPTGLPLPCSGTLSSSASETSRDFETDGQGRFTFQHLAPGLYRLTVQHPGFARSSSLVEVRSAVPAEIHRTLVVEAPPTELLVTDADTLIDPHRTGVAYPIGAREIREQQSAVPGRGLLELVNEQPGWLFESGAVLHPRGSEYQTLLVVDGVPMDENRSPGFAPEIPEGQIAGMNVLTGNYPAEYGRKLGGIVEVVTERDSRPGFHGDAELGGGSFASVGGLADFTYGWKHGAATWSAFGSRTDRYLDPPVLGNFTNAGAADGISGTYDWDVSDSDRLHFSFARRQTLFQVPNENLQQAAGQRQDRDGREDVGQVTWTHELTARALLNLRATIEDLSANFWSNALATPIVAFQQRGFRRGYFSPSVSVHRGRHEFKFGGDAYYAPVSEALQYRITDFSFFDQGTTPEFRFADRRIDSEQSLFAQDNVRLGRLTVSAGLRWDHYRLVAARHAWSPRLGAAWSLPKADLVLRVSYDRAFLTPAMENLLLASSAQVNSVESAVLRVPVEPSRGNFWEAGFSQGLARRLRLDASFYRRTFVNYADDDVFLNTGISFPISFQKAEIHGVDVKLELPSWGKFSGFLSYSNMLGVAYLPVSGGLFLGDEALGSASAAGRFPISQDQRNTARARVRTQLTARAWLALSGSYGSGLPSETDADPATLAAEYGAPVVSRVNFADRRVRPNFSLGAALGADLWRHEKKVLRVEISGENLTNHLNVINVAGLFSGTGIGEPRSASARLRWEF